MRTEGTRDSQSEDSTVSTTVKTTVAPKGRAFRYVENLYAHCLFMVSKCGKYLLLKCGKYLFQVWNVPIPGG
jgi:hypothetical protein